MTSVQDTHSQIPTQTRAHEHTITHTHTHNTETDTTHTHACRGCVYRMVASRLEGLMPVMAVHTF